MVSRNTSQLADIKDEIIENNEGRRFHTLGLLLDFQKTFGTVQHYLLLFKLEQYKLRGRIRLNQNLLAAASTVRSRQQHFSR